MHSHEARPIQAAEIFISPWIGPPERSLVGSIASAKGRLGPRSSVLVDAFTVCGFKPDAHCPASGSVGDIGSGRTPETAMKLSKRGLTSLWRGCLHYLHRRSIGSAQLNNTRSYARDLDTLTRVEPRPLQPASHESDFRSCEALPEIAFGLDFQCANERIRHIPPEEFAFEHNLPFAVKSAPMSGIPAPALTHAGFSHSSFW